ncbi:uncharacterized protein [Drosophila virilis]|uniref:uncharacterized protein n=1 Tax=Drosophila virilis TaxID=7244 RepID=UPI0038B29065
MSGSKVEHTGQGSNHRIKASESAVMFHGSSASKTLFRYVPITLYSKSKSLRAYALVDEGAECTLIGRALADELELDGPATQLCLKWTGDITKNEPESMSVAVSISAPEHNAIQYALKNVRTIANLDLPEQSIGPQLLKSRKHLSTLPILPFNNVKAQLMGRVSVSSHPLRSKEDERSMQIMEATTTWQTGLLWRFDRMHLPDSYQMAVRRLKCLEAKMSKDPPLKEFMMNTMHDYKQKGYIHRLKDITNPNKKKTRLVWDAAAKVSGMSLNDCLLKGPDTLASLMGVLIRFRERPFADMFHQVKVRLEDQPAQKFLWRDGDSSRFPESFVVQVMTFDASCSPALANYVKNRNAERFVAEHPDAVKAICKNTFVDDWLQSVDTGAVVIQIAETVKMIHASGGFEMRRWTSNSKQVIQALEDDCEELDKRISAQDEAQEKVLGLWWLPGQDLLTFVVTPNLLAKASKERPTKRRVLSVIMSIFDPLGLLGFFNIRAKIILQNIWRSNIGWEYDLTNEDEADWQHWLDLVSNLNAVRIPRCMKWESRT